MLTQQSPRGASERQSPSGNAAGLARPPVSGLWGIPTNGWLWGGIVVTAGLIVWVTILNFWPIYQTAGTDTPDTHTVVTPEYDYALWRGLAVQDEGRYKPFETAARELLRLIVGRERIQGKDAVPIVLMWMFETDTAKANQPSKWDVVPFILCEHLELRKVIFRLQSNGTLSDAMPKSDDIHGKYLSPTQLRTFFENVNEAAKRDIERFKDIFTPIERQMGETRMRLAVYDTIRNWQQDSARRPMDRFQFVALDKAQGSPWFSIGELRFARVEPLRWSEALIKDRVKTTPQMYIPAEYLKDLNQFKQRLKDGTAAAAVDAVMAPLEASYAEQYKELAAWWADPAQDDKVKRVLAPLVGTLPSFKNKNAEMSPAAKAARAQFAAAFEKAPPTKEAGQQLVEALATLLADRDVMRLKEQLPAVGQKYDPDDVKFRMLHMSYLETRYPDVYVRATQEQQFPQADVDQVLRRYHAVGSAYRSGDSEKFTQAAVDFEDSLRSASEKFGHKYPGEDTIGDRLHMLVTGETINTPGEDLLQMELTFNKVQPFKWAWITMFLGLVLLAISLGTDKRFWYVAGLSLYAVSVAFQLYGYFVRITIAGRPPVTNMYETVIWVAFMTGVFAIILEAIYRKKVIALGGALVSTICLILADQLPLALDPKISPLQPVLRSNFWLFIHVLTIVSSYAGGALAWGLGNVTLLLILFASDRRETIKTLSMFTYRALQIAVLLLATGTFLGGWWAAYSWGRFWGWDPKETGALIALLCYVIPLHMRYIGWLKDFGLAVAAIVCFAAILMAWYGINFVIPAGLHAYGLGSGGAGWVYWAALINIEWVLVASLLYRAKQARLAGEAADARDVSSNENDR